MPIQASHNFSNSIKRTDSPGRNFSYNSTNKLLKLPQSLDRKNEKYSGLSRIRGSNISHLTKNSGQNLKSGLLIAGVSGCLWP
jgi:hypothetical protein